MQTIFSITSVVIENITHSEIVYYTMNGNNTRNKDTNNDTTKPYNSD